MSAAAPYNITYSFSGYQSANPGVIYPGNMFDTELGNVRTSVNALVTNIKLIQKDDGSLGNSLVGLQNMTTDAIASLGGSWTAAGAWAASTNYTANVSLVSNSGNLYIAVTTHTSGSTFSTDLSAGKWMLITSQGTTATSITFTPTGTLASTTVQTAIAEAASEALQIANNLSDVGNAATARNNLGLGGMAVQGAGAVAITGGTVAGITDLAVADGGTGVSTLASGAMVLGAGSSAVTTLAAGTARNVAVSDGTTWTSRALQVADLPSLSASTMPNGSLLQIQYQESGTVATGTTVVPADNTIPQNTEGDQYLSVSITPTYTTSKLRITVTLNLASTVQGHLCAALFQDTTANALACMAIYNDVVNLSRCVTFTHVMTAGTASATTFKVRAGNNNAGTTTLNGESGTQLYGGVLASAIVVEEVKG